MKLVFIEARAKAKVTLPNGLLQQLPQKICIATDVQFIRQLPSLKKQLESAGKTVSVVKGAHAKYEGQILGCSHLKLEFPAADAFLYVGDGLFHPKALLLGSDKDVYIYNPFSKESRKLPHSEAGRIKKHEKAAIVRFLHAKNVGVLVSVKLGQTGVQANTHVIYSLQKKFPEKKFYFLAFDTLDFSQLENFPFVECFVSTACSRLIDDYEQFPKPVINMADVLKLKK